MKRLATSTQRRLGADLHDPDALSKFKTTYSGWLMADGMYGYTSGKFVQFQQLFVNVDVNELVLVSCKCTASWNGTVVTHPLLEG